MEMDQGGIMAKMIFMGQVVAGQPWHPIASEHGSDFKFLCDCPFAPNTYTIGARLIRDKSDEALLCPNGKNAYYMAVMKGDM